MNPISLKKLAVKNTFRLLIVLFFASNICNGYAQSDESIKTFSHSYFGASVCYSPDGKYLASGGGDKTIKIWELSSGQCIKIFEGHIDAIQSVCYSPDGKYLASGGGDIKVWELSSGQCIKTFEGHGYSVWSICYSPDGKYLASGGGDHTIKIWGLNSGKCFETIDGHAENVTSVRYSPDGKYLASGSFDETIKIWELSSDIVFWHKCIKTLSEDMKEARSICYSPDGKYLAGSSHNTIKIWDLSSGQCIKTFEGHPYYYVTSVCYSPDGKYLASSSQGNTIKIWDISSGQCIKTFEGHAHTVWSISYSPDGKYLASGSQDETIKIWDIQLIYISGRVKKYIEPRVHAWQQKGEFEKTSDYQLRVNEQTRQKKIEEYTNEALAEFKKEKIANFNWGSPVLKGNYDPDNESYLIESNSFGEAVVKVPLAEAPAFKEIFRLLQFTNPNFIIKDDEFVLSKFSIVNPANGKTYYWNSNETPTYALTNIQYNFTPIEHINIPQSQNQAATKPNITQTNITVGKSDVDVDIPVNPTPKTNTYALIIGNEDYSSYQTGLNTEVNVDFAINDAKIFKEYCTKTLGIPEKQIKLLTNATSGQMNQGVAWLTNLVKIDNGNAELIFYYSGHGLPDEQTKEAYLIPVDISGSNVAQGIKLSDLYAKLNEYPTKKVTVFLDACFSGGARNQGLIAMKGMRVNPIENTMNGNMVVFSSSTGDESSGVYREKQHGYMTYFLLKKLQETKGNVTYKELATYIIDNVKKETALGGKTQTPQLNYSKALEDVWKNWIIK